MFVVYRFLVILILLAHTSVYAQSVLTLERAEALALQADPASQRWQALGQAQQEQAIAEAQLPDPQLSVGLMNFPTDTFARDQEPMTQIQLGLKQMLPRGDTLQIKRKRGEIQAQSSEYQYHNQQRQLRREVRLKWLELYYWKQAQNVVRKNRVLFSQMVQVTEYQYGTGRRNQQDVIRAELELSRLDDRLLEISTQHDKAASELAVLVQRDVNTLVLPDKLPDLAFDADVSEQTDSLKQHPKLMIAQAQLEQSKQGVALAREAYKPGWMVGVNYGLRDGQNMNGSDRADFLSLAVTVDLPLFTNKRQDRRLAASQHRQRASQSQFDDVYLKLKQQLEGLVAEWKQLNQRVQFHNNKLVPQARQNSEAALFAYQNDRADFSVLVRARITQLNTRLQALRMQIDLMKIQAKLRYIIGEVS